MSTQGHVYFIEAVGAGVIKIGFSTRVAARLSDLDAMSPIPLVLLGAVDGTLYDEQRLHRFFRACRVRGEWFGRNAILPFVNRILIVDPDDARLMLDDVRDSVVGGRITLERFTERRV